jgi:hypothetical protein
LSLIAPAPASVKYENWDSGARDPPPASGQAQPPRQPRTNGAALFHSPDVIDFLQQCISGTLLPDLRINRRHHRLNIHIFSA